MYYVAAVVYYWILHALVDLSGWSICCLGSATYLLLLVSHAIYYVAGTHAIYYASTVLLCCIYALVYWCVTAILHCW